MILCLPSHFCTTIDRFASTPSPLNPFLLSSPSIPSTSSLIPPCLQSNNRPWSNELLQTRPRMLGRPRRLRLSRKPPPPRKPHHRPRLHRRQKPRRPGKLGGLRKLNHLRKMSRLTNLKSRRTKSLNRLLTLSVQLFIYIMTDGANMWPMTRCRRLGISPIRYESP